MTVPATHLLHGLQNPAPGKPRQSFVYPEGRIILNLLLPFLCHHPPYLPVSNLSISSSTLFHSPMRWHIYHCGALTLTSMYMCTRPHPFLESYVSLWDYQLWPWHWIMYFSIGFAGREETRRRKKIVSTFKRSQKDNPTFPRFWRKGASKLLLLWL